MTLGIILMVATVSILFFLREIFIPLALAILLSFVLAPAMRLLQRVRVPRAISAVIIVIAAFGVLSIIGTVMARGVGELTQDLPRYQAVLHDKITTLKGLTAGSRTLDQAADILRDLSKELQLGETSGLSASGQAQRPVPVIVREPEPGAIATVSRLIAPLISPLAMTGVIIVFVIFILVRREDLRDRIIRLTGTRDLGRTTAAINDAGRRLSRFYLTQLALNSGFGFSVGLGLWAIGVPSPAIWGILATALRFVPYIGAFIAAVLPLALAAAIEPGWGKVIETAVMFAVIEALVGQVIEPLVYGRSTGLSPVAVVVATTFWTWLWGPIGLVLATPLTMCLVVLGRHVERLRFLEVLFGNRPALSPAEIFYQRMLAADPAEAADHAEQFLKKRTLLSYYETVAMEGLRLAQTDIGAGLLDEAQMATIAASASELVTDLDDDTGVRPAGGLARLDPETQAAVDASTDDPIVLPVLRPEQLRADWNEDALVCIGGSSEIDEVAARIFAQILDHHGLPAKVLPASSLRSADLFRLDISSARWICVSFLDALSHAHVRHATRKLRRKAPQARIVIGAWSAVPEDVLALRGEVDGLAIFRTLQEAVEAAQTAATAHDAPALPDVAAPALRSAS